LAAGSTRIGGRSVDIDVHHLVDGVRWEEILRYRTYD
jgi:hypothetical protein